MPGEIESALIFLVIIFLVISTLTEVLILNTRASQGVPVLTNLSGKDERDFGFVFEGGATVHTGCSLLWQSTYYMFGGYGNKNQIARLDNCQLTKIGDLSFQFSYGGCTTADNKIHLCFNDNSAEYDVCRSSLSPTGAFEITVKSTYKHLGVKIASHESKLIKGGPICIMNKQDLHSLVC